METLKYDKITLIGMPGVGKTTFGKLIANETTHQFIDIDILITNYLKGSINDYILTHSESEFLLIEESIILNLALPNKCIISTGGSVVYSKKAMNFLKKNTTIVFLSDTLSNIKNRINDLNTRGIVNQKNHSFETLYNLRNHLYEKYQDITIKLPIQFTIKSALESIYKQII